MNVHAKYMSLKDVRKLSSPLLEKHFRDFGFTTADVVEDSDFDGSPIFRMDAHVEQKVPANTIVDALHDIHSVLRSRGEERVVFLTTKLPSVEGALDAEEDFD